MIRLLLSSAALLLTLGLASCASDGGGGYSTSSGMATDPAYGQPKVPPMAEARSIDEQDCTKPMRLSGGNLRCK